MDRTEEIKSSIKKWNPGIWNEMKEHIEDADMDPDRVSVRFRMFRVHMWGSCGFCRLYNYCERCPLFPEHCRSALVTCYENENTVGKMVKAWEEKAVNMFHFQRRKLVKFMASQLIYDECGCDMCDGTGVV